MTREEATKIIDTGKNFAYDEKYVEAFDMAIKALAQTRWIPVSERLPEDHTNVLICLKSNQITIGLYNSHRLPFMDKPIGWGADAPHDWSSDDVAAWMLLPQPYEAKSEVKE